MKRSALLILLAIIVAGPATAQVQRIEFSDPGWVLAGDDTRVDTVSGQTVLRLRTGIASFRPLSFQDGTIEFDVAMTHYRSFAYVRFRAQAEGELEEVYLRPHKSRLPDAIQYTPVYNGASNWQLYHGRGSTGAAWLPPEQWIHVRVVLSGSRAAVFVGDTTEPQLIVPHLARDPAVGYLSLRCFVADPDMPEGMAGASYRNLVVRPGEVPFDFATVEPLPPPPGVVTAWRVSESFVPDSGPIEQLPGSSAVWRTLSTDQRGLLVLGRHLPRLPGGRRSAVLVRLTVTSDHERSVRFNVGYSDEVSVFLNGRLLFAGNDSYSFDQPRRQGLIGLDQGTLYLPLRRGSNELVLAVSDVFGGWGVMGQFPDREGIRIEPR
jgi:hypothetical protein